MDLRRRSSWPSLIGIGVLKLHLSCWSTTGILLFKFISSTMLTNVNFLEEPSKSSIRLPSNLLDIFTILNLMLYQIHHWYLVDFLRPHLLQCKSIFISYHWKPFFILYEQRGGIHFNRQISPRHVVTITENFGEFIWAHLHFIPCHITTSEKKMHNNLYNWNLWRVCSQLHSIIH